MSNSGQRTADRKAREGYQVIRVSGSGYQGNRNQGMNKTSGGSLGCFYK